LRQEAQRREEAIGKSVKRLRRQEAQRREEAIGKR